MNPAEIARAAEVEHGRKALALAEEVIKEAWRALTDQPALMSFTKYTDMAVAVCQSACALLAEKGYTAELRGAGAVSRWFNAGSVRIIVSGWSNKPTLNTPDGGPYRQLGAPSPLVRTA